MILLILLDYTFKSGVLNYNKYNFGNIKNMNSKVIRPHPQDLKEKETNWSFCYNQIQQCNRTNLSILQQKMFGWSLRLSFGTFRQS